MRRRLVILGTALGCVAGTVYGQTAGGGAAGAGAAGATGAAGGANAASGSAGGIERPVPVPNQRNNEVIRPGVPAPTTGGTANGTSVNSSSGVNTGAGANSSTAGVLTGQQLERSQTLQQQQQNLPPGLQNRPLPPGLAGRDQLPPGLNNNNRPFVAGRGAVSNTAPWFGGSMTNSGRFGTNALGYTGTNTYSSNYAAWSSNQFGLDTNLYGGAVIGDGGVVIPGAPNSTGVAAGTAAQTGVNQQNQNAAGQATASRSMTVGPVKIDQYGDKAYTAQDQALLNRIRASVLPVVAGSPTGVSPVHFVVRNGVLTLTGNVPSNEIRQRVLDMVSGMPGVLRVESQVGVGVNTGSATGGAISTGEAVSSGTASSAPAAPRAGSAPITTTNSTAR